MDLEAQGNKPSYGTYEILSEVKTKPQKSRLRLLAFVLVLILVPVGYLFVFHMPSIRPDHVSMIPDLIRVQNLEQGLLPSHDDKSQLVVVGDIHGMLEPLEDLLEKVDFKQGRDHLIALGDFTTRGPNSLEVIELLIDLQASCVRGNHEDEILHLYADYHGIPEPGVEGINESVAGDSKFRVAGADKDDMKLVRSLLPHHVQYISSCSAIIDMGRVAPKGYKAVACHGGLMWNVDNLQEQDPDTIMSLRTLEGDNNDIPSKDKDGVEWMDMWKKSMKQREKEDRVVVYYGHAAYLGLNIKKYTRGHDTGCAKGRRLSASVITQSKDGSYDNEIVSTKC